MGREQGKRGERVRDRNAQRARSSIRIVYASSPFPPPSSLFPALLQLSSNLSGSLVRWLLYLGGANPPLGRSRYDHSRLDRAWTGGGRDRQSSDAGPCLWRDDR